MKNITKDPSILNQQTSKLSVSEYIIGQRFRIKVNEQEVTLEQDADFNTKTFGKTLDLLKMWEILQTQYGVDKQRLLLGSPYPKYTLECIWFDNNLMQDMIPEYHGAGLLVVDVILNGTTYVPASRLAEYCNRLSLPTLTPLFIGYVDEIKTRWLALRCTSKLASNKLSGGLIIRNEPFEFDPVSKKMKCWFVEPDYSNTMIQTSDAPEAMAHELLNITFTPAYIVEYVKKTNLHPILNKPAFKKGVLEEIHQEFNDMYDDYKRRCAYHLGTSDPDHKFDTFLKKEITKLMNTYIVKMKQFKSVKV